MVQCGKCDHWIHATCESISDETYEILSELPEDSVVFNCRLCAPQPPGVVPPWRQAITDYTLESFAKVSACYNVHAIVFTIQPRKISLYRKFHPTQLATLAL